MVEGEKEMPGSEFIGQEEQEIINEIFTKNKGYLYRYGGPSHYVSDFEKEFAKYFKVKYAHAVSSGTAALKLSLQALGVKPGDEVITQAHTFIATVEAICEVGATPVIVDINKSLNMDPEALADAITSKTKVVIPVHMSGVACDMKRIKKVVEQSGTDIKILEDNAQCPGGTFKGQFTGTIGDVGIFSFDFGKTITTGEGGMVVSNDEKIYNIARGLSDHGHAFNPNVPRGRDECIGIGANYKMMEIQGALGIVQLRRLDEVIARHRENKEFYIERLKDEIDLRERPDPAGDIGVSVSFFLETPDDASKFVKKWITIGGQTFNLPDAKKWHSACEWNHIKMETTGLMRSNELLNRCVAIPIKAKMDKERMVMDNLVILEIMKELGEM
jgi:8-amino-3,8-dideoxy-alpha-D-manno-octulosonate transaminase